MRERRFGEFQNRPFAEYHAAFRASGVPREESLPLEGEAYLDVSKRVEKFLDAIKERHAGQSVLFADVAVYASLENLLPLPAWMSATLFAKIFITASDEKQNLIY